MLVLEAMKLKLFLKKINPFFIFSKDWLKSQIL